MITGFAVRENLNGDEYILNTFLNVAFSIIPDMLIRRWICMPLAISDQSAFAFMTFYELKERYDWGEDNITQPDGCFSSANSMIGVELKINSRGASRPASAARNVPQQSVRGHGGSGEYRSDVGTTVSDGRIPVRTKRRNSQSRGAARISLSRSPGELHAECSLSGRGAAPHCVTLRCLDDHREARADLVSAPHQRLEAALRQDLPRADFSNADLAPGASPWAASRRPAR